MKVTYIDNRRLLEQAHAKWKNQQELGIDLECENNLYHYGTYISLIQISTKEENWVVDVLALKDVSLVMDVLEDVHIEKILHDVGFDLRIIHHQFNTKVNHFFDTFVVAQLLGKKEVGLGSLLKDYFGIEKKNKFQMADWTKRPLKKEMIEYAINDTKYLIALRDKLKEELMAKGRLSWAKEEFKHLEEEDFTLKEPSFWDFRGLSKFSDQQRALLKRLYDLRTKVAKAANRPVHFVMNTKHLTKLVKDPPTSIEEWKSMRGVHPEVKRRAQEFFDEVHNARGESLRLPVRSVKRYNPKQRKEAEKLGELRDRIASELHIERHLILNKDQIRDMVLTGKSPSLRSWQKELLGM